MIPERVNQIRKIVEKTISHSTSDLDFSQRIASRSDLSTYEKVFAGCITRQELCSETEEEQSRNFIVEEIENGFIVSETFPDNETLEEKKTYFENINEVINFVW